MAGCVVAGFGIGWLVDWLLNSFPGFALVGLGLGIVAGLLVRLVDPEEVLVNRNEVSAWW